MLRDQATGSELDLNPYEATSVEADLAPSRPRTSGPHVPLMLAATLLGAGLNFGGWALARWGMYAPRQLLFAPLVLLGLQDMSDPLLGAVAGAVLFAIYAGTITSAQRFGSRLLATAGVVGFHLTCVAAADSHAPWYAFF